jgi:mannose-6-phosphate isomerase-like protein (cupin superfamily)
MCSGVRSSNTRHMTIDNNLPVEGYLLLEPDGGERLRFLGDSHMHLKVDADDTNGVLCFYEYVSQPGVTGPPQHIHHGHDETFYVVDGIFEFTFGTEQVTARPGAFLYVPRGRPHTFRNAGEGAGRFVGTFAPARFAEYFRELARIIECTGGPPERDVWTELYGRYDTEFLEGV